jgi:hypothetical protein
MILLQGCPDHAKLLKEILDAFSLTTGLTINYAKSTLVTINQEEEEQIRIANILGCPIASFPQTYLGLPISDSNLPGWVLQPLIHSLDCSIGMFSLRGASSDGCLMLTKSVLSALTPHFLACAKAPLIGLETNISDSSFELKQSLINMVQQSPFCGKDSEDANAHLQHFLEIYNTFTIRGVS